jgi:hypothetical protein
MDGKGNLYAAEQIDIYSQHSSQSQSHYVIMKWDGVAWIAVGSIKGNSGVIFHALAVDGDGNLYAGGEFDTVDAIPVNSIAKWDGSAWSALGGGIEKKTGSFNEIFTLAIDNDGNLYAGGQFHGAGKVQMNNIAKWDGVSWSALGSGLRITDTAYDYCCSVNALAIGNEGNLYAGGKFDSAGGVDASNIAKWDGAAWSPLGSGVRVSRKSYYKYEDCVNALVCDNKGTLYVGGGFETAGGKTSINFAQCKLNGANAKSSRKEMTQRPFLAFESKRGLVCMHFNTATKVHLSIYSLSGREVYRAMEFMVQGDHTFRIKAAGGLARGAYIAQVKAGTESLRCRNIIGQ